MVIKQKLENQLGLSQSRLQRAALFVVTSWFLSAAASDLLDCCLASGSPLTRVSVCAVVSYLKLQCQVLAAVDAPPFKSFRKMS